MATIVTRAGKGSPLTNTEVDSNFSNLNTDKAELSGSTFSGAVEITNVDGLVAPRVYVGEGKSSGTRIQLSRSGTTNKLFSFTSSTSATPLDIVVGATTNALSIDASANVSIPNGNLDVTGSVVADSLTVDSITIDGNDISTTNSNGNLTITPNGSGNVNINSDTVAITAAENESASLVLASDEADDNPDLWRFRNNTDNTLTIGNQISGSSVDHITITPNATVTNSIAAFAGKITAAGSVTANAGVVVDNITIDGNEIDVSSGDLTLDVASTTIIDSGSSGQLVLKHSGTEYGTLFHDSNHYYIQSQIDDGDIIFRGQDGSSTITALTLDMSNSGSASFSNNVNIPNGKLGFTTLVPSAFLDVRRDANNSGNQLIVADTEGGTAGVRTYSTSDGTGLILNHYYAVSGSPYIRYSDFVSSMADGAATAMRFLTKPLNANPAVALTLDNSQNATFSGSVTSTGLTVGGATALSHSGTTLSVDRTGGATALIELKQASTIRGYVGADSSKSFIVFNQSAAERFSVGNTGNVNIPNGNAIIGATTAPSSDAIVRFLEIENSTSAGLVLDAPRKFSIFSSSSSTLTFRDETAASNRLIINSSGSVGIGVSPSANSSYMVALQLGEQANLYAHTDGVGAGSATYLSNNITHNSGFKYINADAGSQYTQASGAHKWSSFASGSAGGAATENTRMTLTSDGTLLVGKTGTGISTAGIELTHDNVILGTRGGVTQYLNRLSSAGHIIQYMQDGTTKGNISVSSFGMGFGGGTRTSDFFIKTDGTASFASGVNLGVGTSSPAYNTQILSGADTVLSVVSGDSNSASLYLGDSVATRGRLTYNNANDSLAVYTDNNERCRLTATGEFLIGCTSAGDGGITLDGSPSSNSVPSMELVRDFSGTATMIRFTNIGGSPFVGSITSTTSATAYNTSSDERLKNNIKDADDSGSKVDAIQVRQFDWKTDGEHQDYGMVAQELLEVAPDAVTQGDTPDEMMGVDYSKLVPMLIKEIQSLRQRVAQLEE